MQDKLETKVTAIYWPEERELTLFKRCVWVTMGKTEMPSLPPSSKLLSALLNARHSPVKGFELRISGGERPVQYLHPFRPSRPRAAVYQQSA